MGNRRSASIVSIPKPQTRNKSLDIISISNIETFNLSVDICAGVSFFSMKLSCVHATVCEGSNVNCFLYN